jgi:hypothetical protein
VNEKEKDSEYSDSDSDWVGLVGYTYILARRLAGWQAGWHGNMRRQAGLGWLGWQYALAGWQ